LSCHWALRRICNEKLLLIKIIQGHSDPRNCICSYFCLSNFTFRVYLTISYPRRLRGIQGEIRPCVQNLPLCNDWLFSTHFSWFTEQVCSTGDDSGFYSEVPCSNPCSGTDYGDWVISQFPSVPEHKPGKYLKIVYDHFPTYSLQFSIPSFLSELQLGVSFGLLNNQPPFFSPSEADYMVSEQFSFYSLRLLASAQPPTWRTRVCLFVCFLPLDLSGMGDPTSSYATAGIALRVSGALKPHRHDKVKTRLVGNSALVNLIIRRSEIWATGCVVKYTENRRVLSWPVVWRHVEPLTPF
jgi:hypothetical protein